ncbi:hypothetical protein CONPUDRAFT_165750 [Coniophora puteana RWD-64-598 SS2]|uniref:F-box domain-containing protein n=1 Tax=Coniophora puteana (strain RWD-64-598) TaxID=741705 RepID=A0A5M3MM16_CONPW|nr:uncharacterized protein CONPUDRAFT_165750 [Coniophora puteana RWD-64-598 SS2]EIW80153.1 hypothetical protein CONPUDRAFT_165750 [Coniophora puteana RWD-64-598 SS2]
MQNVPASDMSITSRLSMLRAQGRAWEALSWSTPEPVVLPTPPGVTMWRLVGDVFCIAGPGFIQCIRLPSSIKRIAQQEWRIYHSCGESGLNWDFCYDPSQDLLVLFEGFRPSGDQESYLAFKTHVLTLSTGSPHPAATSPVLLYAPEFRYRTLHVRLTLQVCDRHFAMLMEDTNHKEQPKFAVWNWMSGLKEVEIVHSFSYIFKSFSLLPDDLLLVGVDRYMQDTPGKPNEAYISVYDLDRATHTGPYTLDNEDDHSYICKLDFDSEFAGDNMFISSTPLFADKHTTGLGNVECASPFTLAPEAQLIVINLNIEAPLATRVFLPVSVIMQYVSSARKSGALGVVIPWSDWGLSPRVFVTSFRTRVWGRGRAWHRYSTRGLRIATVLDHNLSDEEWTRGELYELVAIMDINPMTHATCSGLGKDWTRPQPESEQWEGSFRVAWRKEVGFNRRWTSCLLGDDLIVLVSEDWFEGPLFAVMALEDPGEEPTSAA